MLDFVYCCVLCMDDFKIFDLETSKAPIPLPRNVHMTFFVDKIDMRDASLIHVNVSGEVTLSSNTWNFSLLCSCQMQNMNCIARFDWKPDNEKSHSWDVINCIVTLKEFGIISVETHLNRFIWIKLKLISTSLNIVATRLLHFKKLSL